MSRSSIPAGVSDVYEAAQEPKELVTIEGAGHGICQDDGQPHATPVAEPTTAFGTATCGARSGGGAYPSATGR